MSEKKKIAAAQLYLTIADKINRLDIGSKLPDFPERFHLVARNDGSLTVLREGDRGLVVPVIEDVVTDAIVKYTAILPKGLKGLNFDHGQAVKCMRYWKSITIPINEPALLLELSEPGLCYRRLPFDSIYDPTRCPMFEELISRVPCNAKALMMFFGSLFFEEADRQQYLYLYGEGGSGKSSLTRLLQRIFGEQYQSENSTLKPNQFWMSGLLNKRLVVFSETNNSKIVMSEMIKTITGSDPVRIEEKNKAPRTALLRCKLIIVSNYSPTLSGGNADQRRIVLCEILPTGREPELDYEEKLWAEAAYIVGICKNYFLEFTKSCAVLPVERDLSDLATLESEQELADMFDQNFVESGNSCISGSELRYVLKAAGVTDTMRIRDFTAYASREHKVRKVKKEKGLIYFGLRSKVATERPAHITLAKYDQ